jgi:sulfite reductase (NADPH) flavoprotein alpha-component
MDYFYEHEWQQYIDAGVLHMHVAFSRDQAQKVYVQDRIAEHQHELVDILHNQHGVLYVSGYVSTKCTQHY